MFHVDDDPQVEIKHIDHGEHLLFEEITELQLIQHHLRPVQSMCNKRWMIYFPYKLAVKLTIIAWRLSISSSRRNRTTTYALKLMVGEEANSTKIMENSVPAEPNRLFSFPFLTNLKINLAFSLLSSLFTSSLSQALAVLSKNIHNFPTDRLED